MNILHWVLMIVWIWLDVWYACNPIVWFPKMWPIAWMLYAPFAITFFWQTPLYVLVGANIVALEVEVALVIACVYTMLIFKKSCPLPAPATLLRMQQILLFRVGVTIVLLVWSRIA